MNQLSRVTLLLALFVVLTGCASATPTFEPTPATRVDTPSVAPTPAKRPAAIAIPNVKGKTVTMAKWRLETAGFKTKVKWVRDSQKHGRVISQRPARGSAKSGTTVALTVSAGAGTGPVSTAGTERSASSSRDQAAASAFQQHKSGISLSGEGTVTRVLADDNTGDRHQRFILGLASGQTLLVAHNIDIAPRLPSLAPGDSVAFKGVYEWTSQGGTVHWTHHDPGGAHPDGWLKYKGTTYR